MNLNPTSPSKEATKTTGMLKPTTEIAKIISNQYLKELKLKEECRIRELELAKWQEKFQKLTDERNERARIRAEYENRNKINKTTTESLTKALNELQKYKCELKSSYVAAEKAMKAKKLKYKKILSDYESAWNETSNKLNKMPDAAEFLKIQEENRILEKEIEKQEKLTNSTKIQFAELKNNIGENFSKTVVKFSKCMTEYANISAKKQNEKKQLSNAGIPGEAIKLFRKEKPIQNDKNSLETANIFSDVDVTIFDEMMVPAENLESQHSEEDDYSFLQNDIRQPFVTSKDSVEGFECSNQEKNKKLSKNPIENVTKATVAEENESHYFHQQPMEYLKQTQAVTHQGEEDNRKIEENVEGVTKKLKGVTPQTESEIETVKDIQMEYEEYPSEESYEKNYSFQKETYDCQKTYSPSSDDLPPSGEIPNESIGSSRKPHEEQKKPRETETNDFKSFTGFFTLGSENDNPMPSIFKLF